MRIAIALASLGLLLPAARVSADAALPGSGTGERWEKRCLAPLRAAREEAIRRDPWFGGATVEERPLLDGSRHRIGLVRLILSSKDEQTLFGVEVTDGVKGDGDGAWHGAPEGYGLHRAAAGLDARLWWTPAADPHRAIVEAVFRPAADACLDSRRDASPDGRKAGSLTPRR